MTAGISLILLIVAYGLTTFLLGYVCGRLPPRRVVERARITMPTMETYHDKVYADGHQRIDDPDQ